MTTAIKHAFSKSAPRSGPGGTVGDDKSLSIAALQRWNTLNVHAIVPKYFNRCRPVLLHDPLLFIWHAKQLSPTTIGIEIEGTPGGETNMPWAPGGKNRPPLYGDQALSHRERYGTQFVNDLQIEWARTLVSYYIENVPAWAKADGVDHEIKYIQCHRQSEPGKPADPGQQIWREVGIWAAKKYKLGYGPTEKLAGKSSAFWFVKRGNPIADIWTGEKNGIRYAGDNPVSYTNFSSGGVKGGRYNRDSMKNFRKQYPCRWEPWHKECYISEYPVKKYLKFNESAKVYAPGTTKNNINKIQNGKSVDTYNSGFKVSGPRAANA